MRSRSIFVTVLAWVFIVGASLTSFASIMQVVMISMLFRGNEFAILPPDAPVVAVLVARYFHLLVYCICALSFFALGTSVALLKRKNWARLAFIFLLSLGIIWQVGALAVQYFMLSQMPAAPVDVRADEFERMSNIVQVFGLVIVFVIVLVFVWIIKKLAMQPIKGEFACQASDKVIG